MGSPAFGGFDPNKPSTPVDLQGFDPSKPSEPVGATEPDWMSGLKQVISQAMQAVPVLAPILQHPAVADALVGAAKGLAETGVGLGQLASKAPGVSTAVDALYGTPGLSKNAFPAARQALQPTNTGESVGKGLERAAEFFVPAGAISKVKGAIATGSGLLDAVLGAGVEGASAGAVGAAQTGSPRAGLKTGMAAAATSAVLSAAQPAAKMMGERIESALVKPTAADVNDGFKVSNIYRYGVGGTLRQSYDKVQAKLNDLGSQLKNVLAGSASTIDLGNVLADTEKSLSQSSPRQFGTNVAMKGALSDMLQEIDAIAPHLQNGSVAGLATANDVKRGVGNLGAWLHDPTGSITSDAQKAKEIVANAFYGKLKDAINAAVPSGEVAMLNQQMSDLIPISNAIVRRIPVAERANVLKLGDLVSAATGNPSVGIMNRVLQSGRTANALVAAASSDAVPSVAAKVIGSASTPAGSVAITPDAARDPFNAPSMNRQSLDTLAKALAAQLANAKTPQERQSILDRMNAVRDQLQKVREP